MLPPIDKRVNDQEIYVCAQVRLSHPLAAVFGIVMSELEHEHRRLAVYFDAVTIMLKLPGSSEYEYEELLDGLEARIASCDQNTLFNVLNRGVGHLLAEDRSIQIHELHGRDERLRRAIIEQVPGGADFKMELLPAALTGRIDQLSRNGLLNIVAECLDRLMIAPSLPDDDGDEDDGNDK